uniref:TraD/TraG TraM recognition site domain-containing protein n=1 Tax=Panagrolaimus davidi TaxID=227884 RepID=A0A914QZ83_9BILA
MKSFEWSDIQFKIPRAEWLCPAVPQIESMGIQTYEGVPTDEDLQNKQRTLLIMDDLLTNVSEDYLATLFSKKTHHLGICLIFVTQGLFDKKMKFCRSQAHYVILMKAFSAQLGVRNFGQQNFAHQLPFFMDSYRLATKDNFGYLVVDMSPTCPQELRLRTNIFPEETVTVFTPRVQI